MPLALAFLTLGAWVAYAGLKGLSLADVLTGKGASDPLNPDAGEVLPASGFSRPGDSTNDATNELGNAAPGSGKPTAGGKIIGTPYAGTHTLGNWQSDNAIDIAYTLNSPIYAVEDGRVTKIREKTDGCGGGGRFAGNQVTITAASGKQFFYTHMCKLGVKQGQEVKSGQAIGSMGQANGTTHLHFAVSKGDPRDYWK